MFQNPTDSPANPNALLLSAAQLPCLNDGQTTNEGKGKNRLVLLNGLGIPPHHSLLMLPAVRTADVTTSWLLLSITPR